VGIVLSRGVCFCPHFTPVRPESPQSPSLPVSLPQMSQSVSFPLISVPPTVMTIWVFFRFSRYRNPPSSARSPLPRSHASFGARFSTGPCLVGPPNLPQPFCFLMLGNSFFLCLFSISPLTIGRIDPDSHPTLSMLAVPERSLRSSTFCRSPPGLRHHSEPYLFYLALCLKIGVHI